jgi:3'-phosphoadenosine 5'-phosphosulfate sulfotransferase (PAPS reductase)/FAD synthetase
MTRQPIAIVSVSGGKDSTATALLALDTYGPNRCRFVFADTGHEHPLTLEYLAGPFAEHIGPVTTLKADFTADIERKRQYVAEKWPDDLIAGKPGKWVLLGAWGGDDEPPSMPADPSDPYCCHKSLPWVWSPARRPMTAKEADTVVARALSALRPTGAPFLDLCVMKGRFPSRKGQFCTQELKRRVRDRFMLDMMIAGHAVESWQGVRPDESRSRAGALDRERTPEGWEIVRPIAGWTAQQVVDFCRARGVPLNPLYSMGCNRVGCMPCINTSKAELAEIARRFPEEIARVAEWERLVGMASKRGKSTLLHHADGEGGDAEHAYRHCNIRSMVDWAKTSRGGRQYDLLRSGPAPMCSSSYGLCDEGEAA